MASARPLWQQALIVLLGPPIMALWFRLRNRGWANVVEGGNVSEKTVKRQRLEFWVLLCIMYVMAACIVGYAHLRH